MKQPFLSFLALFLLLHAPFLLSAQQWQWGKRAQNPTREIATDKNGNTYVLWAVSAQCNIDGHPIPSNGYTDIGVTSFRCDGSYRWTKVIGGSSPDAGFGLATDTLGGLYILGMNGSQGASTCYVDDDTTFAPTTRQIMLLKYDTAGNFKWARMPEQETSGTGNLGNSGFNLSVEPDGTVHAFCVLLPGTYAGGAYTATFPDGENVYDLKYSATGAFTGGVHLDMTRSINAGISTYGFTMIYDAATAHYYYGGRRYDPYQISFGTTTITGSNFLACFGSTGNVLWVKKSNNDAIQTTLVGKPATDNAGNVYVTGYSYNEFTGGTGDGFGSFSFNNTMGVWGFPILVKFNPQGTVLYASNASGNTDNSGNTLMVANGIVALAGQYAGGDFSWGGIQLGPNDQYYNTFLARFDATSGNVISIDTLSSAPQVNEYPWYMAADRKGNFYVGGEFSGSIDIAGVTMNKQDGYTDGYMAKFGLANCNCIAPAPAFSRSGSGLTGTFNYTGSLPVDSVRWTFGDGQTASGLSVAHTYSAADTYTVCVKAYNSCDAVHYCKDEIFRNLSSAAMTMMEPPTLYPNPVQHTLHFSGLDRTTTGYRLYNTTGILVQQGTLHGPEAAISFRTLAPGFYLLRLQDGAGNEWHTKLLRQ